MSTTSLKSSFLSSKLEISDHWEKKDISKVAFKILPTILHCRISELGSLFISHVQVRLVKNRSSPFLETTMMKSTHRRRHRENSTYENMPNVYASYQYIIINVLPENSNAYAVKHEVMSSIGHVIDN